MEQPSAPATGHPASPEQHHRILFEIVTTPPRPKCVVFQIDGAPAEEDDAQRMSLGDWFAGTNQGDVQTYDQVMSKLPPLPREDVATRAYAAADVDAGAPPHVWAGVEWSLWRARHEQADVASPATSPRAPREFDVCRMPAPDVETLEASLLELKLEIEKQERRRSKKAPSLQGARRVFGDVKNRVAS